MGCLFYVRIFENLYDFISCPTEYERLLQSLIGIGKSEGVSVTRESAISLEEMHLICIYYKKSLILSDILDIDLTCSYDLWEKYFYRHFIDWS